MNNVTEAFKGIKKLYPELQNALKRMENIEQDHFHFRTMMLDLANKEDFRSFKEQIKKEVAVLVETAEQSVKGDLHPLIASMTQEQVKMN